MLIDASSLGEKVKEGKNQKTLLSATDEAQIIDTFNNKDTIDDFATLVSYEDIQAKNYSLSAGQYFEIKITYNDISEQDFQKEIASLSQQIDKYQSEGVQLNDEIQSQLKRLKYEK